MSKAVKKSLTETQVVVAILAKAYEDRGQRALVDKHFQPLTKMLDYCGHLRKFAGAARVATHTDDDHVSRTMEVTLLLSNRYAVRLRLEFTQGDGEGPRLTGNADIEYFADNLGGSSSNMQVVNTAEEIDVDLTEGNALHKVLDHLLDFAVEAVKDLLEEILGRSMPASIQRELAKKVVRGEKRVKVKFEP